MSVVFKILLVFINLFKIAFLLCFLYNFVYDIYNSLDYEYSALALWLFFVPIFLFLALLEYDIIRKLSYLNNFIKLSPFFSVLINSIPIIIIENKFLCGACVLV